MKYVRSCTPRVALSLISSFVAVSLLTSHAQVQSGQVLIKAVNGEATYSTNGNWQALKENMIIKHGTSIKTGPDSTIDLILQYNGSVLRLTPDSMLSFDKLSK